jgi:hypothetical protein
MVQRNPLVAALGLVALTLLAHAVILATPGFYSHDEWQKFDHIRLHGFGNFARAYGIPQQGPEFGYPVRPIGFLQQGIAALWMQSAPLVSHLVSIPNHAAIALVFVWVLLRAGVASATAALAGALFVLSPLATMATGWTAASFDQLYILFLLVAAAAIVRLPEEGMSAARAAWILFATAAALLTKETAMVAPGMVLLLGYLAWCAGPERFAWRPFGTAFLVTLIPIIAYLLFRAPAIMASLAGHSSAEYTPDLWNVPGTAWRFFAYPFRFNLVEISTAVFRSQWQQLLAGTAHLVLVGAVYALFRWRLALAYVAGYFLFLLPVLALPNPGTQCLYGAALAMSLAIAATLTRLLASGRRGAALLIIVGAVGLSAHSLVIQRDLYEQGECQSRFLTSLEAMLAQQSPSGRAHIVVVPETFAPAHIAIRSVAAREAYTDNGQPIVAFVESSRDAAPPDAGALRARMTATCSLVPE